jgi:antitoxin YefM
VLSFPVAYGLKYKYDNAYNFGDRRNMNTISYSAFRARLASMLDKVNDDHTPILVTRQNGKPAVVMSLEDFHAYEETAYLMASPRNAERLNRAIAEVEAGKIQHHELMEE